MMSIVKPTALKASPASSTKALRRGASSVVGRAVGDVRVVRANKDAPSTNGVTIRKLNMNGNGKGYHEPATANAGHAGVGTKLPLMMLAAAPSEEATSVITSNETGFATAGSAGVEVQRGTTAHLEFSIQMTAVTDQDIQSLDTSLRQHLDEDQMHTYDRTAQHYGGGLNIPVLSWFGINASASYDKESVEEHRKNNRNYDEQAKAVQQSLNNMATSTLFVTGALDAQGVSFIPVEAKAYIKVAQLQLTNGKTLNVVSTNGSEAVVAADSKGNALPSSGQKLNIIHV